MDSRIWSLPRCLIFLLFAVAPMGLMASDGGFFSQFDAWVGSLNGLIASVLFFDVFFGMGGDVTMPFAVAWLVVGATFFTLRMGFINLRAFKHAIDVVRGRYDDPNDVGEVSHFQALTAALSATVGLGNIAGVAIAISLGGPGATFWMIVAGFLGMSSKFVECTLGQAYRELRPDGHVLGGPMEYLSRGFKEKGLGGIGKFLAGLFSVLCILGSLGGGNAFQVKQSFTAVNQTFGLGQEQAWIYGLIMAVAVGVVIIGGIKRIAEVAEKIVPAMCLIYVVACLYIILAHVGDVPAAFGAIISGAFNPDAAFGGAIGVLIIGFKRAAFSNEAGVGSASIAHSAARTHYPVREGIVSLLEPFVDTVVICTMTALVIVITGAYNSADPAFVEAIESNRGAALTSLAFESVISWFPYVLAVAVTLFAYSTMISWSYYGERSWVYLFGEKTSLFYKLGFVVVTFLGATASATNVLDFSDLMILAMAVPNVFGLYILHSKVKSSLGEYWKKYRSGEMVQHK